MVSAGYFTGSKGSFEQSKCPKGKYGRSSSRIACDDCPTGRYNDELGIVDSGECKDCIAGTYNDARGLSSISQCKKCGVGRYSATKGNVVIDQCLKCRPGMIQPSVGQSKCSNCLEGRFGRREAMTKCDVCAVGRFQNIPGSQDCIDCRVGLYQQREEMGLHLCPAGYFQAFLRGTACDSCPLGYYGSCKGLQNCLHCPPGQTTYENASTKCVSKVLATVIPEFLQGDEGIYVDENYPNRICANWFLPETDNEAVLPRIFDHILFQVSYDKEFPLESTNTSHPRLMFPKEPFHPTLIPG